mmetsp:Transcript_26801/g.35203  ORF Transcript_26801/g.35203 Transcript_26801/m.35203 type:complete len:625 (+) Transcript_26801:173-2047(+)
MASSYGKMQGKDPEEYTVCGYFCDWDTERAPKMQRLKDIPNFLSQDGKPLEVYGYSFKTSETGRKELFVILRAGMGWKERYYPQGDGTQPHTWVVKGDETRGSGVDWKLENVEPGTEISIYFSPSARILEWRIGALQPDFQLSAPKLSFWGCTLFSIADHEGEHSLIHMLTMAVDHRYMLFSCLFHMTPFLIMSLLAIWILYVANDQIEIHLYKVGMVTEWINVVLLLMAVFIPQLYGAMTSVNHVIEVWTFSQKVYNNKSLSKSLRTAAVIEFLNKLQPLFALCLSIYVALYLSENIFLNVVLNVLALEFVADVDESLIKVYIKSRFGEGAAISFVLLDVTYSSFQGGDFWRQSNSSKDDLLESLSSGSDLSSDWKWRSLVSSTHGLGLIGKEEKQDESTGSKKLVDWVHSFDLQMDIVDWSVLDDQTLLNNGRLYLATTTVETWDRIISKNQKRILFQSFPSEVERFSWRGVLQFSDLELSEEHAPHISKILVTHRGKLTEANFQNNPKLGDETLRIISNEVGDSQLRDFVFSKCGVTDAGAQYVADWLRQDRSIQYLNMADNENITDVGALELARALTEGSDRNSTLQKLFLVDCRGVSRVCRDHCNNITNNRIKFDSFWN